MYPQGLLHQNKSHYLPLSLCNVLNDPLIAELIELAPESLPHLTAPKNNHQNPFAREEDEDTEDDDEATEEEMKENDEEKNEEDKEEDKQEATEEDNEERKQDDDPSSAESKLKKALKEKAALKQQVHDLKQKYQELQQAQTALEDSANKLSQEKEHLQDTLEVQLTQEADMEEKDHELHETLELSQTEVLHLQNKVQSLEEELQTSECAHENALEDQEQIHSMYGRIIAQGRLWDQKLIRLLEEQCDPNDETTSLAVSITEIFKALAVSLQQRSQLVQPLGTFSNTDKYADESSMVQFMLQALLSQPNLSHSSLLELIHRLDRQLEPLDQQVAGACKQVLPPPTVTQQHATTTRRGRHQLEVVNKGDALSPVTLDEALAYNDHGNGGPNKRARVSISQGGE